MSDCSGCLGNGWNESGYCPAPCRVCNKEGRPAATSGRYSFTDPDSGIECDTEPPPPEAEAYRRVSWMASTTAEALELDYLIKAYKRMTTENRVRLLVEAKKLDTLP